MTAFFAPLILPTSLIWIIWASTLRGRSESRDRAWNGTLYLIKNPEQKKASDGLFPPPGSRCRARINVAYLQSTRPLMCHKEPQQPFFCACYLFIYFSLHELQGALNDKYVVYWVQKRAPIWVPVGTGTLVHVFIRSRSVPGYTGKKKARPDQNAKESKWKHESLIYWRESFGDQADVPLRAVKVKVMLHSTVPTVITGQMMDFPNQKWQTRIIFLRDAPATSAQFSGTAVQSLYKPGS